MVLLSCKCGSDRFDIRCGTPESSVSGLTCGQVSWLDGFTVDEFDLSKLLSGALINQARKHRKRNPSETQRVDEQRKGASQDRARRSGGLGPAMATCECRMRVAALATGLLPFHTCSRYLRQRIRPSACRANRQSAWTDDGHTGRNSLQSVLRPWRRNKQPDCQAISLAFGAMNPREVSQFATS